MVRHNNIFKFFRGNKSCGGGGGSDVSTVATEPPLTIADLISGREWSLLENHLISGDALLIDDPSLADYAITEHSVLHFAMRFQAPLRIVALLSELYPSSISSSDASGRYPIHVACKWSATPDVIKYLVQKNSSACGVQDHFGKTPMHYVAEFYPDAYQPPLETLYLYPMDDSMLLVVKLLRSAAPASVNLEDNEGRNAIEYALKNHVSPKVIKSMQRAYCDDWTNKQVYIPNRMAERRNPTTAAARSA